MELNIKNKENMKKHELLETAMRHYPKGTKFTFSEDYQNSNEIKVSSGIFHISSNAKQGYWVTDTETKLVLWSSEKQKWVKIISECPVAPEKIAVKVDNETEFNALMRYYAGKGWKWTTGCDPLEIPFIYDYPAEFEYRDKFNYSSMCTYGDRDYTIIPFSDFAKEHNIPTKPKEENKTNPEIYTEKLKILNELHYNILKQFRHGKIKTVEGSEIMISNEILSLTNEINRRAKNN